MLSFVDFLRESIRNKKDPHELAIRTAATIGRLEHKYKNDDDYEEDPKVRMVARTSYGECDHVSHCVAKRLKTKYPSVKVVYSKKFGQPYPDDPDGREGLTGHSWVEIPETGHYVDPSHDMFRIHGYRQFIPRKGGLFPQSAIKIGKIGDRYHKKYYSRGRLVDDSWRKK